MGEVSYKRQELPTLREHLGSLPIFDGVRVAHLFSFLCCGFFFRPVSFVPNVASISVLYVLSWPSGFSSLYFL